VGGCIVDLAPVPDGIGAVSATGAAGSGVAVGQHDARRRTSRGIAGASRSTPTGPPFEPATACSRPGSRRWTRPRAVGWLAPCPPTVCQRLDGARARIGQARRPPVRGGRGHAAHRLPRDAARAADPAQIPAAPGTGRADRPGLGTPADPSPVAAGPVTVASLERPRTRCASWRHPRGRAGSPWPTSGSRRLDGLRAAFVLGLQRVLPGTRFSLTQRAPRAAMRRTGRGRVCCGGALPPTG
jgi:hypothetical protein